MSNIIDRCFTILQELSYHRDGRTLSELAEKAGIPLSATHRILNDLIAAGYVRKDERHGEFTLTMSIVSLALRHLSSGGIVDVAQPILERLAAKSKELVRLAVVDEDQLIYVAKAQGATVGLRYDPEMGQPVTLSCSAAGMVWLGTKSEDEALRLVAKQGLGDPKDYGPDAPATIKSLMTLVEATKAPGYATTVNVFLPGMSSMATPVFGPNKDVLAVLIIAGPTTRLTQARMDELSTALIETASELGAASAISPIFQRRPNQPLPTRKS
ncbi:MULTISPECIES: IclR family transcriptional regulator [unclassified Achromobacter]|uniref:IclR family transcriptional regulator n=1 Tax=unclassified Achromobacter TaxID=2626865 RepID=UPI000B51A8AB|nr:MULTISPECIES: IclR family transcriptional regulator [unclassified Achromobacter]OWT72903.1 IclR family transcriptional regulator [Achromobacter sp. HZ34]OWT74121.1 IclR family transcriptional regulator [Achromobacter sp. HZ28]